jgi:hypothetical protein
MRLYTFINFYLSQIQQGIQTAHLVHELFNKYNTKDERDILGRELDDWSRNHKTIYVMNAGADPDIQQLLDVFARYDFPYTEFSEDDGLCRARTGCCVLLPAWVYDVTKVGDMYMGNEGPSFFPGKKYYDLIDLIKSKRLA